MQNRGTGTLLYSGKSLDGSFAAGTTAAARGARPGAQQSTAKQRLGSKVLQTASFGVKPAK